MKEWRRWAQTRRSVETTPNLSSFVQSRILNFMTGASSGRQVEEFISRKAPFFTDGALTSTGGHVSQDLGGIFNIPSNIEDPGRSPIMTKELRKLRNMILSVPGVIQPIPKFSPIIHRATRLAPTHVK